MKEMYIYSKRKGNDTTILNQKKRGRIYTTVCILYGFGFLLESRCRKYFSVLRFLWFLAAEIIDEPGRRGKVITQPPSRETKKCPAFKIDPKCQVLAQNKCSYF